MQELTIACKEFDSEAIQCAEFEKDDDKNFHI